MALETTTDTAQVDAPPADLTLAEHQAQYYPKAKKGNDTPNEPDVVKEATSEPTEAEKKAETARNEKGQFQKAEKERHRAKSQDASPEDVPRIRELTAKLRAAERERDELKARTSAPAATTPESAPATKRSGELSSGFTDPKPTIASLIAKGVDDPYAELPDAVLEWHEKKRAFEQAQKEADVKATESIETIKASFLDKETEFRKAHADYDDVRQLGSDEPLTPLLGMAILTSDNGPAIVYHLAQQPTEFYALLSETLDRPPTDRAVELLRRRLEARVQAATTGSAAPTKVSPSAPRPLNPVRTGPIRSGAELPGDEASLSEHEKVWGPKRRK